jgi:bacillithiol synthase
VKAHCLPFTQIPHTTRLFTDFLSYTSSVQSFYPESPHFSEWFKEQAATLRYDSQRRRQVAEILGRQNKSWDPSPKTLANLERFRNGAATVVTGQQVGLFGGPMFSIYKALTAVKLAEEATAGGVECVPIFWLATYDHDLAEINHIALPGSEGAVETLAISSRGVANAPVGSVRLGDEILPAVERATALLGESDATTLLRDCYRPGETLGAAFARFYARLFADWGVIVLDASDGELHRIAQPIYRAAVERSEELAAAVVVRGEALEAAGYHQQVKVTSSSVLLFTLQDGARTAIHRRGEGDSTEFVIGNEATSERISQGELLRRIASSPEKFSPNVLLRPIIEDYLLPTLAYTGGAAETAYFAQAGAVYERLLGHVTPVIPRFSATIVEPKMQRVLGKHGINAQDVFAGPEALRRQLAANSLPQDLQAAFDATKNSIDANFSAVKEKLTRLDPTLVDAAETSRSKMQYQIERLYSQATRAESQKGELVSRHAEILSQALYPEKGLQERGIGGIYFLARYGNDLLRQLSETIHSDCHDHQILEL